MIEQTTRIIRICLRLGPRGIILVLRSRAARIAQEYPFRAGDWRYLRSGLSSRGISRAAERGEFAGLVVLSARFDAFAGRLWHLLNAVRVSKALGAKFCFYWPARPLDGIYPAEEMFDANYLSLHCRDEVSLKDCRYVRTWTLEDIAAARGRPGSVWYDAKHRNPYFGKLDVATRGFQFRKLPTFAEAFESVRFLPDLEQLRESMRGLERFGLAVHGRRGDVYDGDFRIGSQGVTKTIPLPLIKLLLEQFSASGQALLVSNDDVRLRNRLGLDRDDLAIGSDFTDAAGDERVQVFRDFMLLTKADRIFAGASVFAGLPALIGRGALLSSEQVLGQRAVMAAVWDFVRQGAGQRDLEVALACSYLHDRLRGALSNREHDELLGIAVMADPLNPTFVLARAASLCRRGSDSAAAEVLSRAASVGLPDYCLRLVEHSFDIVRGVGFGAVTGGFLRAEDWVDLEAAAKRLPWAAFYVALHQMSIGDRDRVAGSLDRAGRANAVSAVSAAVELFNRSRELDLTPHGNGFSNSPAPEDSSLDLVGGRE